RRGAVPREALWARPGLPRAAVRAPARRRPGLRVGRRRAGLSLSGASEQRLLARERLARGGRDLDPRQLSGGREPAEVDDLVVARAPAELLGVGARGPLDEHLERAPDKTLSALARAALYQLDQALHAL